jgi:hypothetical protein
MSGESPENYAAAHSRRALRRIVAGSRSYRLRVAHSLESDLTGTHRSGLCLR